MVGGAGSLPIRAPAAACRLAPQENGRALWARARRHHTDAEAGRPPGIDRRGHALTPGGGRAGGIDRRRPGRMGMKASPCGRALFLAPVPARTRSQKARPPCREASERAGALGTGAGAVWAGPGPAASRASERTSRADPIPGAAPAPCVRSVARKSRVKGTRPAKNRGEEALRAAPAAPLTRRSPGGRAAADPPARRERGRAAPRDGEGPLPPRTAIQRTGGPAQRWRRPKK